MARKNVPEEANDYASLARARLASVRSAVLKKLRAIVARPLAGDERTLRFELSWGLNSNAFVQAWPRDESGEVASDRRPFGDLLEVDPPPGREDDPDAYSEDRPVIAQVVVDALAEWWAEAGGADYPLPALAKVEGDPLRRFDLRGRAWETDERAVRAAQLAAELTARLQARLAERLRGPLVRKLSEALARVTRREGCHPLFPVSEDNGPYRVGFQVNHESSSRAIVRQTALLTPAQFRPILDDPSIDWEALGRAGVDRRQVVETVLREFLADAWQEAGGHDFPVNALLGHGIDDDFSTFDLVTRRPHTDSMGRTYRGGNRAE